MATKSITITEEAYTRLASLRQGQESFSQIINRITGRRRLLDFAGVLSQETADRIDKRIRERRLAFDKEMEDRRKRMRQRLA